MASLSNLFPTQDEEAFEREFIKKMEQQENAETVENQPEPDTVAEQAVPDGRVKSSSPEPDGDDIMSLIDEIDDLAESGNQEPQSKDQNDVREEVRDEPSDRQDETVSADNSGEDPFEKGQKDLDLPVEAPSRETRAQMDFMDRNTAIITCGDEIPEQAPARKLTIDEQMQKLGFPPRPRMWPSVMAWPMQPDFNMMARKDASEEELRKYLEGMQLMQKRMLERAQQIDEYIRQYNNIEDAKRSKWRQSLKYPTLGTIRYFKKYDYLNNKARINQERTKLDPYYGIRWACLLDEKATRPAANIVSTWSYNYARTNDGGVVVSDQDSIRFREFTQQAVTLAIHEGVARGWETIKIQGNTKFVKLAIQAANQSNVRAEITEYYGPAGIFRRKHVVMPAPPGVSREEPRVETENIGVTPDSPQARKLLPEPEKRKDAKEDKKMRLENLKQSNIGGDKADPAQEPEASSREVAENVSETQILPDEDAEITWINDGQQDLDILEHSRPS